MYKSKDHRLVATKKLTQLRSILRLTFFLITYHLGTHKGLMYLCVKVISVCYDKECEVAMQLTFHLPHKHHHAITLARTLCMPEYAKLTFQFLSALHTLHQIINTKILMVLGNNLDALVIKKDEILYIVEQTFFFEQTINKVCYRQTIPCNMVSIQLLFLVIHPKPFKEEFISSIPSTKLCLQSIGEHTNLVKCKDVWYILSVTNKVLIVRLLYLYCGVL